MQRSSGWAGFLKRQSFRRQSFWRHTVWGCTAWLFCIAALAVPAGTAAAQERRATLAGLWQGIDAADGSLRTLSISGPDRDGLYEVNAYDTYWSICDGDRAVSTATGKISAKVLRTSGILRCADGRETAIETEFRPERFIQEGVLIEIVIGTDSRTRLFRINR